MKLSRPSYELANKLLGKVRSAKRLKAQMFFLRKGDKFVDIDCLEAAASFLGACCIDYSQDELLKCGSRAGVGYIDLVSVRDWAGETLGDKELAEAIGREIGEDYDNSRNVDKIGKHFRRHIRPIRELMEQRLKQCKDIIKT